MTVVFHSKNSCLLPLNNLSIQYSIVKMIPSLTNAPPLRSTKSFVQTQIQVHKSSSFSLWLDVSKTLSHVLLPIICLNPRFLPFPPKNLRVLSSFKQSSKIKSSPQRLNGEKCFKILHSKCKPFMNLHYSIHI